MADDETSTGTSGTGQDQDATIATPGPVKVSRVAKVTFHGYFTRTIEVPLSSPHNAIEVGMRRLAELAEANKFSFDVTNMRIDP